MTVEQGVIAGLAGILVLLVGYLVGSRGRGRTGEKAGPVQGIGSGGDGSLAALAPALGELRGELRGQFGELHEKVRLLQTAVAADEARRGPEDAAWEAIQRVEHTLAKLDQLPYAQQELREQVTGALRDLAAIKELQTEARQRFRREDDAYTSLQRLAATLLGSATSGATGERLVQEALAGLPPQWVITNHAVGGKRVEFAIRLPDGLVLPVDSKVVAQGRLETLGGAEDAGERESLEKAIRTEVMQRAGEVRQYVDERTPGFTVMALPDAAYTLCGAILPRAFQEHRALIVPYSLLGPFILMVYEQHLRAGMDLDSARIARIVADIENRLSRAQQELNGRISAAITSLSRGRDVLQTELADVAQALALLRGITSEGEATER
ncbi:MAG: hypothetical protein OJF49_000706 [Ktedonobacterales bacterium]|jgi:DNA anti-recombination protein RmuC|nr:MAG: hypothetical protein OJF49_000706 [Ktedonobacterales bacterium]